MWIRLLIIMQLAIILFVAVGAESVRIFPGQVQLQFDRTCHLIGWTFQQFSLNACIRPAVVNSIRSFYCTPLLSSLNGLKMRFHRYLTWLSSASNLTTLLQHPVFHYHNSFILCRQQILNGLSSLPLSNRVEDFFVSFHFQLSKTTP
jgi:hypothetical protein